MFRFRVYHNKKNGSFTTICNSSINQIDKLRNKVNFDTQNLLIPNKKIDLASFIYNSKNEYELTIKSNDISRINTFLTYEYVTELFIKDLIETIGMFQMVPQDQSVNKSARLHRNLENNLDNNTKIWSYNNFYVDLNSFYWKMFLPLNIKFIRNDDDKIKYFIGILLEKISHINKYKLININKCKRPTFIQRNLDFYHTINTLLALPYFQQFEIYPDNRYWMRIQYNKTINHESIIINLNEPLVRDLCQNNKYLFDIITQ